MNTVFTANKKRLKQEKKQNSKQDENDSPWSLTFTLKYFLQVGIWNIDLNE